MVVASAASKVDLHRSFFWHPEYETLVQHVAKAHNLCTNCGLSSKQGEWCHRFYSWGAGVARWMDGLSFPKDHKN